MARRADKAPVESSSDSEKEWRLEGRQHLREQHAATITRTHEDFEGSHIAFTSTAMVGITPGQNLLLVPAAEVKKKEDQKKAATAQAKAAAKEAAEKFLRERQEKAQWAKEAEEAKAKKEARAKKAAERTEAAEAKKRPEPKEAAEAKKRPEPKETAEAKKRPEPKETAEAEKGPESKETAENAQKGSEPTEAKEKAAPLVKRQPMPPKVKAMPKKAGKVKKVVLKSRAQRGIPERVDTALRMLSTKKRERKKMGYLVKAINHAMRRKAESQSGPPVRRTWAQHIKDHYAQIKDKEQPFVEVTVSEIIRGVPLQVTAQPKTPPAQPKTPPAEPKTPPGAVIKIEGGLELPAPPPVPPRRRLPTPPRNPRTPSEAWSMVSSRDGRASREKKKARIENPGQTVDELGQIVDPDGSIHVE